jgi:hypothetical protein
MSATTTPNRKFSQFKSRFSSTPQYSLSNSSSQQDNGNSNQVKSNKSLFAAYDSTNAKQEKNSNDNGDSSASGMTAEQQYWLNNNANLESDTIPESKSHKQLPSWLREGLEKIKQEKQKKVESTTSTTASAQSNNEPASKSFNTRSNVFEQEDDDEDEQIDGVSKMTKKKQLRLQQLAQLESSTIVYSAFNNKRIPPSALVPIIASKLNVSHTTEPDIKFELNDDEKNEIIMSLVKTWMTEILLEITNQEMTKVAKEVYHYEKGI